RRDVVRARERRRLVAEPRLERLAPDQRRDGEQQRDQEAVPEELDAVARVLVETCMLVVSRVRRVRLMRRVRAGAAHRRMGARELGTAKPARGMRELGVLRVARLGWRLAPRFWRVVVRVLVVHWRSLPRVRVGPGVARVGTAPMPGKLASATVCATRASVWEWPGSRARLSATGRRPWARARPPRRT